ncbi:hypothetical protein KIW84_071299 [Lathyrus oleraceus]|uniref:Uncharacterized protein n=1 Tax=Pisum sativum TaxID=3888 RepID=A0A9D4VIN8_PEA|nr:hypothetical protein KIW84_071299 [Pisum sativum]
MALQQVCYRYVVALALVLNSTFGNLDVRNSWGILMNGFGIAGCCYADTNWRLTSTFTSPFRLCFDSYHEFVTKQLMFKSCEAFRMHQRSRKLRHNALNNTLEMGDNICPQLQLVDLQDNQIAYIFKAGLKQLDASMALVCCSMINDDLLPLYAGWKVVLCRDIPHSVIKFYTYEILKQVYAMEYDDEPSPATVPCDASIATELAKLSFHISSPKFG